MGFEPQFLHIIQAISGLNVGAEQRTTPAIPMACFSAGELYDAA
jgi:hypothetical protein